MTTRTNARTVDDLKADGHFFAAGALAYQLGHTNSYGVHFGFRSTRDAAIAEFQRGFLAAQKGA